MKRRIALAPSQGSINGTLFLASAGLADGPFILVDALAPVELAGAACYRREKCETCHNLVEGEPKIGPTLATVGQKGSADRMIDHLRNPSDVVAGSPMPAFQLSPALLNCLSAFLLKVTPENTLALDRKPEFAMQGAMVYQMNLAALPES